MNNEIFILGVGPYTIVIAELAEICGYTVKGFYHFNNDRDNEIYHGYPIISSTGQLYEKNLTGMNFALSMGDNVIRKNLSEQIKARGGCIPSLIHPSVEISKTAQVSPSGVILKRNVSIQSCSTIKQNTIICDNTVICHHTTINENCFIACSVVVGAFLNVLNNVFIGQGSIITSGKVPEIGENAMVGAGAVVVKKVEKNTIVAGNPARVLKKIGQINY